MSSDRTVRVTLAAFVAPYIGPVGQATTATRGLQSQILSTEKSTKATQGAMQAMGRGSMLALGGAGVAAYALVKGITDVTRANIEFESSFAGIRKTIDATEDEFAELEEGVRRLATEIPVSVNELNRIGELGGQLGIAKENLVEFIRVIAMMGVATDLTTEEAATKMAQFAEVTGMPISQVENLASAVVDLGNKGATTEPIIMEYASRIAGAGEIAGFTEAEIVSLGAAMGNIGVPAEAGGTAVQKVLLSITESVTLGGEKLETFAETAGMTADDFAQKWRSDPAAAFTAFVEGLGDAGQDGIRILKELGLTDQRLTRAFLSLGAAGDQLNETMEIGNAAFAENNALQEEAAKRFETTEMKVQLAMNQIEDLKIAWGEWTAQGLGQAADALTDVMQVSNSLNDSMAASVNLLSQLASGYTDGSVSAEKFIDSVMKNVEGLSIKGMPETISQLREQLEDFVGDVSNTSFAERWFTGEKLQPGLAFGRSEASEMQVDQAKAVLELVRAVEAGVPIFEDGDNALGKLAESMGITGDESKEAGQDAEQAVSGFEKLFKTADDFRKWRDSAAGALDDLSGQFAELADDASLSAVEIIDAFEKQIQATKNFRSNLDTLIHRGAKPELIQDLIDMGDEGARWAEALASASNETFEAFVRARGAADSEMDGLTAAVRRAADGVGHEASRIRGSVDSITAALGRIPRSVVIAVQTSGNAKGALLAGGQLEPSPSSSEDGPGGTKDEDGPGPKFDTTITPYRTFSSPSAGLSVVRTRAVTNVYHIHADSFTDGQRLAEHIKQIADGRIDRANRDGGRHEEMRTVSVS